MAELVEHNTSKQGQNKSDAGNDGGKGSLRIPVADAYQVNKQEKGGMDVNINAGDARYFP